jgi:hypothetical protein
MFNDEDDIDNKIYLKSKKNQKHFKDSMTIAARLGKNNLMDIYRDEVEHYSKCKTPWWEE